MACPWFDPTEPLAKEHAPWPSRAPLGALFDGVCRVTRQRPDLAFLRESCNFGYARASCPAFPGSTEADAVRFSWHRGRIIWILEKNHAPLAHGAGEPPPELARLAEVFKKICTPSR